MTVAVVMVVRPLGVVRRVVITVTSSSSSSSTSETVVDTS